MPKLTVCADGLIVELGLIGRVVEIANWNGLNGLGVTYDFSFFLFALFFAPLGVLSIFSLHCKCFV